RFNLATSDGLRILEILARGVAPMMDTRKFPEGDPRSWMFQWHTHSVRGDRSRAAEVARIFGVLIPRSRLPTSCGIRGASSVIPWAVSVEFRGTPGF